MSFLKNKWSFWLLRNNRESDRATSWKAKLKQLATVDSWDTFRQQLTDMDSHQECDVMMFRAEIPPMWEHEANKSGGRWVLNMPKSTDEHGVAMGTLRGHWQRLCWLVANEEFDPDMMPLINGVWLNVKLKSEKLSLWTSGFEENIDMQHRIGRKMRELLEVRIMALVFEPHEISSELAETASKEKRHK